MGRTLVTVLYHKKYFKQLITKIGDIEKLIVLYDPDGEEDVKKNLDEIKDFFDDILEIETVKCDQFDINKTAQIVANYINEEENDVVVNVTHGRKIQAIALTITAFSNIDNIDEIVYYIKDKGLINIPKLEVSLSRDKISVLQGIEANLEVEEISDGLGVSKGMVYNHIRDMRKQGHIKTGKLKLTNEGKLTASLLSNKFNKKS